MHIQKSKAIIAIGFGTLIVILVAISAIGFIRTASINEELDTLAEIYHKKASLTYEMRLEARERLISLTLISNMVDPFARDTEMLNFNRIGTRFATARIQLTQFELSPEEQLLLEQQADATQKVRPLQERLLDLTFAGDIEDARQLLTATLIPAQNIVIDLIKKLHIEQENIYHQRVSEFSAKIGNSYVLFMSLLLMATVVAGIIIAYFVIRRISTSEDALFREKERYALAVRGANDGLWDWDLETNQVYFSPRWKDMLGYDDHEIPNKLDEWFRRIHPDDAEETLAKLNGHLNGLSYYFESTHRLLHKDGSYRWVLDRGLASRNEDGKAYRIAGSQTDITSTKLIEEKLRHNEMRLRSILDSVPEGIVTTDSDGNIESLNHIAEEILSTSESSAIGGAITDLITESDRTTYTRQLQKVRENHGQANASHPISTLASQEDNNTFDLIITGIELEGETKFINILKPRIEVKSRRSA